MPFPTPTWKAGFVFHVDVSRVRRAIKDSERRWLDNYESPGFALTRNLRFRGLPRHVFYFFFFFHFFALCSPFSFFFFLSFCDKGSFALFVRDWSYQEKFLGWFLREIFVHFHVVPGSGFVRDQYPHFVSSSFLVNLFFLTSETEKSQLFL